MFGRSRSTYDLNFNKVDLFTFATNYDIKVIQSGKCGRVPDSFIGRVQPSALGNGCGALLLLGLARLPHPCLFRASRSLRKFSLK